MRKRPRKTSANQSRINDGSGRRLTYILLVISVAILALVVLAVVL